MARRDLHHTLARFGRAPELCLSLRSIVLEKACCCCFIVTLLHCCFTNTSFFSSILFSPPSLHHIDILIIAAVPAHFLRHSQQLRLRDFPNASKTSTPSWKTTVPSFTEQHKLPHLLSVFFAFLELSGQNST